MPKKKKVKKVKKLKKIKKNNLLKKTKSVKAFEKKSNIPGPDEKPEIKKLRNKQLKKEFII